MLIRLTDCDYKYQHRNESVSNVAMVQYRGWYACIYQTMHGNSTVQGKVDHSKTGQVFFGVLEKLSGQCYLSLVCNATFIIFI